MCTLTETVFGDQLKETMTLQEAIDVLQSKNLINIGELGELAISASSGISQCSKNTPNIDLVNGVQIKTSQTNPDNPDKDKLRAWFTVKNCTAPIALTVTERKTNRQYFFYIPYSAYKHINGNAIGIPFTLSGQPFLKNDWWYYDVGSYSNLIAKVKAHN